jgi:hypothetical protein
MWVPFSWLKVFVWNGCEVGRLKPLLGESQFFEGGGGFPKISDTRPSSFIILIINILQQTQGGFQKLEIF